MPHLRRVIVIDAICFLVIIVAVLVRINDDSRTRLASQGLSTMRLSNASDQSDTLRTDSVFWADATAKSAARTSTDKAPEITAGSYLVGDIESGKIYLAKDPDRVFPVASMSKLITAITATDNMKMDEAVTITPAEYDVASDTSMVHSGETYTVKELLYPMLLNSSNVAAEALASSSDRLKFLELMSSYAWEIGMPSTFFADPSGIDPHNVSTARDFFELAKYLYKSRPDILALTRTVTLSVATTTDHDAHVFSSIHPFVTYNGFVGGKTGHTPEAMDTMLTVLDIDGHPIAFIVLSSWDRKNDTDLLIGRVKTSI